MNEFKLIFEKSAKDRRCSCPPENALTNQYSISDSLKRKAQPRLPEIAEVDIVRHYTGLSRRAHGVDTGFYPLGSCTMKYNPRLNEDMASLPDLCGIHPLQGENTVQGCLFIMHTLENYLCEICGMDIFTLQPAAGAHGEWTGLMLIAEYHKTRNDQKRVNMLVPDAAHGTNPASAAMAGFNVINIPSNPDGSVNLEELKKFADETTAGLMLTNPNTLGLFEKNIAQVANIVHKAGGLLYYDGANLNAVMGITRPGDMGFDVVHLNLHKTFATPHGGGGPGSGPVGAKAILRDFLPVPVVEKNAETYSLNYNRGQSIGKVLGFYGNFLVCVKALTYIIALGKEGIPQAAYNSLLNANYMLNALKDYSDLEYADPCMHEFVLSLASLKKQYGVSALDVAKSLLEYGIHPPTMYFPLIVPEALMLEPTETESSETLDNAVLAFIDIFAKAKSSPEELKSNPVSTPVRRLDEVGAARKPIVKYGF